MNSVPRRERRRTRAEPHSGQTSISSVSSLTFGIVLSPLERRPCALRGRGAPDGVHGCVRAVDRSEHPADGAQPPTLGEHRVPDVWQGVAADDDPAIAGRFLDNTQNIHRNHAVQFERQQYYKRNNGILFKTLAFFIIL